jgi:hypothetical protein
MGDGGRSREDEHQDQHDRSGKTGKAQGPSGGWEAEMSRQVERVHRFRKRMEAEGPCAGIDAGGHIGTMGWMAGWLGVHFVGGWPTRWGKSHLLLGEPTRRRFPNGNPICASGPAPGVICSAGRSAGFFCAERHSLSSRGADGNTGMRNGRFESFRQKALELASGICLQKWILPRPVDMPRH